MFSHRSCILNLDLTVALNVALTEKQRSDLRTIDNSDEQYLNVEKFDFSNIDDVVKPSKGSR